MKQIVLFIFIVTLLIQSCSSPSSLSQEELELVEAIKFNPEIVDKVKKVTTRAILQLPGVDHETGELLNGEELFDGIYSKTPEEVAIGFIRRNKVSFKEAGYLLFLFEGENNEKSIAVIKGQEDVEILAYRKTDGINHNLENKDIITKMTLWHSQYGVNVIGCGRDWVQLEFDRLPQDVSAFSKEVYEFCPDIVDQGVGSIEELELAIVELNGLWLWWD